MKVIGLVGEKGGGKGTFTEYLKKIASSVRISHLKFSDVLVEVLTVLSLPTTRGNLQKAAQMIDEKFGEGTFSNSVYQRALKQDADIVVLDGVRWLPDEDIIRRFEDNALVYVTADPDTRFKRLKRRNEKAGEGEMTRGQFDREEEAPNEFFIPQIGSRADFKIINDGPVSYVEKCVDNFHDNFLA